MSPDDTADQPDERGSDWEPDRPTRVDEETIVVPMRMYKGITVFSTLLSVALVVLGFFLFDAATNAQSLFRALPLWLFSLVGVSPPSGLVDVVFGLAGITSILVGASSYIVGTRFKTAGMIYGDDEADDTDEDADTAENAAAEPEPAGDEKG